MGYQTIIAALVLLSSLTFAKADDTKETLVAVKIQHAFIPVGFDDNDNVQIVVKGYLPDTCYKMGPTSFKVDDATKTVTVAQMAYLRPGICLEVVAPFEEVLDLGRSGRGDYNVVDAAQGAVIGKLPVKKASVTPGPDDYLYAPVREAIIEREGTTKTLVLSGYFESRCMEMQEVKVNYINDVVVVQPIAKMTSDHTGLCVGRRYFSERVPMKADLTGEYLLHVRIMNGKALNRVVDFTDIE